MHFNAANRYLFVNGAEIIKFQVKDPKIVATPLYLVNISKDFSEGKIKRQAYMDMSMILFVDHNAIAIDDILDIHKNLMKKNGIVQMFGYIQIIFKSMSF